jgi:hypothetical protein
MRPASSAVAFRAVQQGAGLGEAVEEDLHGVGVDRGQDADEGRRATGPGGAGQPGPGVALVLGACWAFAPPPPAMAEPRLLAAGHPVHEPRRDPLAAVGLDGALSCRLEPP